jgi:hypothetical protein
MGALLRLEEEGPEVENVYLSAMGRTQFVLVVLWLSLTLCVWLKGASGSSIRPGTDSRGVQEAAQLTTVRDQTGAAPWLAGREPTDSYLNLRQGAQVNPASLCGLEPRAGPSWQIATLSHPTLAQRKPE